MAANTIECDCPRCGVRHSTFAVLGMVPDSNDSDWKRRIEIFSVCRRCLWPTLFIAYGKEYNLRDYYGSWEKLSQWPGDITSIVEVTGFVSIKDNNLREKPEYLPDTVAEIFDEALACLSVECWNAACVMFRTALDVATRRFLPEGEGDGLNSRTRRDLGLRLPWLFNRGLLPRDLEELASCVREEGNDGAHRANLARDDAEDNYDFAFELLNRIYSEPERVKRAGERRQRRRAEQAK